MKTEQQVEEEISDYTWGKIMSPETRQRLLDDIAEQNEAEPETERRDLPPQNISDVELFLLWLRS